MPFNQHSCKVFTVTNFQSELFKTLCSRSHIVLSPRTRQHTVNYSPHVNQMAMRCPHVTLETDDILRPHSDYRTHTADQRPSEPHDRALCETSPPGSTLIDYFDDLVHDCSNSSALAMELLQSCTKPSIWCLFQLRLKMLSYLYLQINFHCGDLTNFRPPYLCNGNSHTDDRNKDISISLYGLPWEALTDEIFRVIQGTI